MNATDSPSPGPAMRWTEHGPEPIETPAAAPPSSDWDDILEGRLGQATTEPEPTIETEAPEPAPSEDLETIKARLAAKGLVREQPAIRIREVAGDAPRPVVDFEPEPVLTTGRIIEDDDLGDPEELEPELPGPSTTVRCPSCRTPQPVADSATGFRCRSCTKVWRWATCGGCGVVGLTIARQESWRCSGCGAYTRSWWRTPTKAAEHKRTAEAKATQAAERRRREAYAKARRRRWKVLTAGAVAILVTAVGAITVSRHAAPVTSRGASGRVCDEFGKVQNEIAQGAPLATIRASVDTLAADSVDAVDEVRLPAQRLAGSGHPGDKPFDDAARGLATACTG